MEKEKKEIKLSLEEETCRKVEEQGGTVDMDVRWFFIPLGTEPTEEMKLLKSMGYIGQYEIPVKRRRK